MVAGRVAVVLLFFGFGLVFSRPDALVLPRWVSRERVGGEGEHGISLSLSLSLSDFYRALFSPRRWGGKVALFTGWPEAGRFDTGLTQQGEKSNEKNRGCAA